jgi:hypothetical protein
VDRDRVGGDREVGDADTGTVEEVGAGHGGRSCQREWQRATWCPSF